MLRKIKDIELIIPEPLDLRLRPDGKFEIYFMEAF